MNKTTTPNKEVERIHTSKNHTVELEYYAGSPIDETKFIEHLIVKHGLSGQNSVYAIKCLENIVDYGKDRKTASKDQLAYYLYSVVPEVEFKEIVAYIADDCLTSNAIEEKYDYWDNWDGGNA